MTAAAAAAGVSVRARRRVVSAFQDAHALTPEESIQYWPARRLERRWLDRLQRDGAVIAAADGRFYLDSTALERADARRRSRIGVALGLVATAGLAAFLLA